LQGPTFSLCMLLTSSKGSVDPNVRVIVVIDTSFKGSQHNNNRKRPDVDGRFFHVASKKNTTMMVATAPGAALYQQWQLDNNQE
jgi:hypothetical protein